MACLREAAPVNGMVLRECCVEAGDEIEYGPADPFRRPLVLRLVVGMNTVIEVSNVLARNDRMAGTLCSFMDTRMMTGSSMAIDNKYTLISGTVQLSFSV